MSSEWFSIGHTTLEEERTGCTVLLFDNRAPAAVDIRGGAPGTRETSLLDADCRKDVDAILFSGGSAFGLQAAGGVMQFLAENNRGHPTAVGPVPIVPAAIIFDLANGVAHAPTAEDGYRAAAAAARGPWHGGRIGAGTGATVAKLGAAPTPAGLGVATVSVENVSVTSVVVLNAIGDVLDPSTATYLAGTITQDGHQVTGRQLAVSGAVRSIPDQNTTIGAVLVSQPLDHYGLQRCCIAAHDALARCVMPAHTVFDGDTFFAVAASRGSVDDTTLLSICTIVEMVTEKAIVSIFEI